MVARFTLSEFHNYRPQTKFAKVMFLHLSVILFRGGLGPGPGGRLGGLLLGGVSRPRPSGEVGGSAQGGVQAQGHVFTPVCHSVHRRGLGPGGEVGGLPWYASFSLYGHQ